MKASSSRLVSSLGLLLVLAGCVSAPKPELNRSVPEKWLQQRQQGDASREVSAKTLTAADLQNWWRCWNDAALDSLVDQALAQNLDLAQALGRLKQQRLLMGVASSLYKPGVSSGVRTLQDIAAVDSYFHASIDVTWELGLFGAGEAAHRSARAELLSAQAQVRSASVALIADVVRHYVDLRMAQYQRNLLAARIALDERAVQLADVRQRQRLDTSEAVHQAKLQLAQSRAQLFGLKESQARAAHALAVLLGRAEPEPQWLADDPEVRLPQPGGIELDVLPADLIRMRPDIQSAEAAVQRAAGTLGMSRSALYPRFALAGSLLYSFNLTQNRRTKSEQMPLIGPSIDIPLFDWNRRRSQADADEAAMDVAVLGYRQSVLESLAEVEAALAGLRAQQERMAALQGTQRQLDARDAVLRRRQQLGLASDFGRLSEQRALLQNSAEQALAQGTQALAYVALYKALGGAPLPAQAEFVQQGEQQP